MSSALAEVVQEKYIVYKKTGASFDAKHELELLFSGFGKQTERDRLDLHLAF
ncbi:hypothetical protein ACJX0J_023132, partial [Zea mays]